MDALQEQADRIRVLELKKGDYVVVTSPKPLCTADTRTIKRELSKTIQITENKIIVLEKGLDMFVVTKEQGLEMISIRDDNDNTKIERLDEQYNR